MTYKTYRTPFSRAYWQDAYSELKSTRMLVLAAVLIALRVALKSVSIPVGDQMYITVGYFINAVGSMVYGPVVAFLSGVVSDLLGCIFFPKGPYFFPFTVIEGLGSFFFAIFLYRARLSAPRIFSTRLTVSVVLNLFLTPLALSWMYGKSIAVYLVPRIAKNLLLFPLESVLLVLFLGVMVPVLQRMQLTGEQPKLTLTRHHVVVLGAMFVVAIAAVIVYYTYFYA